MAVTSKLPPFETLDQIALDDYTALLGYGASGSGKTWFAGTAGDRMLFINNGRGVHTFNSPLFQQKVGKINPLVVTIGMDKMGSEDRMFEVIKDVVEEALDKHSDRFDVVCLDDATAFKRTAMVRAFDASEESKNSKGKAMSKKYDALIPTVNDYGMEMSFTEWYIAETVDILKREKKHFIMLAHERLTFKKAKAQDIGAPPELLKVGPAFTGVDKNPSYIPALFDEVWRFERIGSGESGTKFLARTIGDENLITKQRLSSGVLKEREFDPNFWGIINRIKEKKNG